MASEEQLTEEPSVEEPWDSTEATESTGPGEVARRLVVDILAAMDCEGRVDCGLDADGTYRITIRSPQARHLVGRNGAGLNALQYLVGLITHRRAGEHVRLILDADNFRARREQTLIQMARKYADEVRSTGHEAVLDPLSAFERRLVHNALMDDPDIYTYSEGADPDRRVVISPRLSDDQNATSGEEG